MISAEEARGMREPTPLELVEEEIRVMAPSSDCIIQTKANVPKSVLNVLMTYGYNVQYNETTELYKISWGRK